MGWLNRLGGDYTHCECVAAMTEEVTAIPKRQRLQVLREYCRRQYDKQHEDRDIAVRVLLDWIAANG